MWPDTNPRQRQQPASRPTRIPERPATPPARATVPRLSRPAAEPTQPTPQPSETSKSKTIEINISLPKLRSAASVRSLKDKLPHVPRKYMILGMLVLALGIGGWLAGSYALKQRAIIVNGGSDSPQAVAATNIAGKPDYPTVLPQGKSIDSLGGWARVSPADKNPVFAYADTIAGTPINVSQQPLPKEFKQNPADAVERLAKAYQATVQITAGSITAYVGTSAKGPQSVIFTTNDLLILIKSSAKIDTAKWGEYISSLK